jgi:hypothetical protein
VHLAWRRQEMEDEGASSDVLEDLRLDGAPSVVVPGGATAPGPREEYDEMAVHYAKQALHFLMLRLAKEVGKGTRGLGASLWRHVAVALRTPRGRRG